MKREPLEQAEIEIPEPSLDLLALNEALDQFDRVDKPAAELVKLRYWAGLTLPQAAEAIGMSHLNTARTQLDSSSR